MLESLFQGENAKILDHFKNETGVSIDQLNGIAGHLIPKISQAVQGSMSDSNLMQQMVNALTNIDLTTLASSQKEALGAKAQETGTQLLNGIFGSEESVSKLISELSSKFGLDINMLNKAIPALSTAVVATVIKNSGGLSSLITSIFSSSAGSANSNAIAGGTESSGLMNLAKNLLDKDHDGSILDDVISFASKSK